MVKERVKATLHEMMPTDYDERGYLFCELSEAEVVQLYWEKDYRGILSAAIWWRVDLACGSSAMQGAELFIKL